MGLRNFADMALLGAVKQMAEVIALALPKILFLLHV